MEISIRKNFQSELYHHIDEVFIMDTEQLMEMNIKQFEKILIDNKLKSEYEIIYDDEENKDDMEVEYNNDIEFIREKFLNKINYKFKMKNMVYAIEKRIYHEQFNKADENTKILMNSRRSDKCMSFINHYRGFDYNNDVFLDNQQWNLTVRVMYGLQIKNDKLYMHCMRCNKKLLSKNILVHIFECRYGLAHHYSHDGFGYWLFNKMNKEIKLIEYEIKPRKLNKIIQDNIIDDEKDDEKDTNEKPDIWVHEQIKYSKYNVSKIILDTTITNIFCKENRIRQPH